MGLSDRDAAYLWDMRESAILVTEFLKGVSHAAFVENKMLRSAVERQLEIIGEAARRLSTEIQLAHPEIPWRGMIGLRNLLVHEYGEVQIDRVWMIATSRIPELVDLLEPLIPSIDQDAGDSQS
jgi:uncharacterized protein with HEPN domain